MTSSRQGTEADGSSRRPAPGGRALRGGSIPARVRAWPFDPDVAHLVVYRSMTAPTDDDVTTWVAALAADHRVIRTGALMPATAAPFLRNGFVVAQRLTLLEHRSPAAAGAAAARGWPGRGPTRRLRAADLRNAERVDRAAFDPPWQLDAHGIDDACRATTHHRGRVVRSGGTVVAYAVSGRDGVDAYLQRLAVDPAHHGQGHGTALVLDALQWAGVHGAHRVLVNTYVDNHRALALYRRLGFVDRDEQLVVVERTL